MELTAETFALLAQAIKFLGAGVAIGAGAIGPGIGVGLVVLGHCRRLAAIPTLRANCKR
jgi:F0F1-type ATP synthase membrane subunit c/vacuolar-type H+-ATPase subunit K